jgi:integrase
VVRVSVQYNERRDRHEVRWREHGRQRSRSFRFKQDADDFDNEVYRRKRMGFTLPFDRGTETLSEWATEAWPLYFVPRLAASSQRNYAYQWDKHVLPALGQVPLRELDAGIVARFAGDLRRNQVGDDTLRRLLGMLSRMMNAAVVEGKIAVNPVVVIDKPRQEQGEWPDPVTPDTVERVRAAMRNDQDRLICSMLGYAGLRPQEIVRADWRHLQGAKLRIYAPKTRRNRVVDLLTPLQEELDAHRAGRASGPIILGRGGGPWTESGWRGWRKRVWKTLAVPHLDGADKRPYRLRGSFASLLAWEGQPITYVAAQLGHSVQTCSRYYLGIFETVDLEHAVPAAQAVLTARERVRRACDKPTGALASRPQG